MQDESIGSSLRLPGYVAYADALLENFRHGRYLAVPLPQWIGLALDEIAGAPSWAPPHTRAC
jgi:hypothetical protein